MKEDLAISFWQWEENVCTTHQTDHYLLCSRLDINFAIAHHTSIATNWIAIIFHPFNKKIKASGRPHISFGPHQKHTNSYTEILSEKNENRELSIYLTYMSYGTVAWWSLQLCPPAYELDFSMNSIRFFEIYVSGSE